MIVLYIYVFANLWIPALLAKQNFLKKQPLNIENVFFFAHNEICIK